VFEYRADVRGRIVGAAPLQRAGRGPASIF